MLPRVFICYKRDFNEFKVKEYSKVLLDYLSEKKQEVPEFPWETLKDIDILSVMNEIQYQVTRFLLDKQPYHNLAEKMNIDSTQLNRPEEVYITFFCVAMVLNQMPDCPIRRKKREILTTTIIEQSFYDFKTSEFPNYKFSAEDFKPAPEPIHKLCNYSLYGEEDRWTWLNWTDDFDPKKIKELCDVYDNLDDEIALLETIKEKWKQANKEQQYNNWYEDIKASEHDFHEILYRIEQKYEYDFETPSPFEEYETEIAILKDRIEELENNKNSHLGLEQFEEEKEKLLKESEKWKKKNDDAIAQMNILREENAELKHTNEELQQRNAELEMKLAELSKLSAGVAKKASQEEVLKALRTFVNKSKQKRIEKRTAIKEMVLELAMANNISLPDDLAATLDSLDDEVPQSHVVNVHGNYNDIHDNRDVKIK